MWALCCTKLVNSKTWSQTFGDFYFWWRWSPGFFHKRVIVNKRLYNLNITYFKKTPRKQPLTIFMLFIPCHEIIFLYYKTKTCTYSIHNSTISHFLPHVLESPAIIMQDTPIYLKHNNIYIYSSSIRCVIVISVVTIIGCKMQ